MHYFLYWICTALAFVLPISANAETLTFRSVVAPSDLTATLTGSLSFPAGGGPFPVVILLHPCGGLERFGLATLQAHARSLQDAGFGTLILDSYGPRNLNGGKACDMRTTAFRRDDAFNAMAVLQTQSKISKDNIFVLGLSDGGVAALVAAKGGTDARFSAAVAYYPGCAPLGGINMRYARRRWFSSQGRTIGPLRVIAYRRKAQASLQERSSMSSIIPTHTMALISSARTCGTKDTRLPIAPRPRPIVGNGQESFLFAT
jgi:poly(3-hydroxybutyrate) depolymerase